MGSCVSIKHNVAWAEAYHHTKWILDASSRLATIDMGRKLGAVPPFLGGSCVPIQHNVAWAEAYHHTNWHLDASSRLATIDMGRKLRALSPFWREELRPHLAKCGLGRGLPPYEVES